MSFARGGKQYASPPGKKADLTDHVSKGTKVDHHPHAMPRIELVQAASYANGFKGRGQAG